MKYVDVTVPIRPNMAVFKGDPPVVFEPVSSIKRGDPFNLTNISMGSHAGTHVDAPSHYFQAGRTVDEIPLDVLIGPVRILEFRGNKSVTRDMLLKSDLSDQQRILIKTDHSYLLDRYSKFRGNYVYMEVDACGYMVQKGMKLVGIDSFSVESMESQDNMCHKVLLGAGIIIVELLNLRDVEPGDYEMVCLPLNIHKGDGAPARVLLKPLE